MPFWVSFKYNIIIPLNNLKKYFKPTLRQGISTAYFMKFANLTSFSYFLDHIKESLILRK